MDRSPSSPSSPRLKLLSGSWFQSHYQVPTTNSPARRLILTQSLESWFWFCCCFPGFWSRPWSQPCRLVPAFLFLHSCPNLRQWAPSLTDFSSIYLHCTFPVNVLPRALNSGSSGNITSKWKFIRRLTEKNAINISHVSGKQVSDSNWMRWQYHPSIFYSIPKCFWNTAAVSAVLFCHNVIMMMPSRFMSNMSLGFEPLQEAAHYCVP